MPADAQLRALGVGCAAAERTAMAGDRFDKLTERARKVLQLAQEESQRFNHNYIGTEHLLLGMLREHDGIAARVLTSHGIELDKARAPIYADAALLRVAEQSDETFTAR